jgi:hypothetical protein
VALKVSDLDSQRMTLRVEQGKGQRDRYGECPEFCVGADLMITRGTGPRT